MPQWVFFSPGLVYVSAPCACRSPRFRSTSKQHGIAACKRIASKQITAPPRFRITSKHMTSYRNALQADMVVLLIKGPANCVEVAAEALRLLGRGEAVRDAMQFVKKTSPHRRLTQQRREGPESEATPKQSQSKEGRRSAPAPPPPPFSAGSAEHPAWCRYHYRGSWWCWWWCFRRDHHLRMGIVVVFKQNRTRGLDEKRTQQCCSRWGSEKAGGWSSVRGISP